MNSKGYNLTNKNRAVTTAASPPLLSLHRWLFIVLILIAIPKLVLAQPGKRISPEDLKKLSVEELMNLEVTSVSKAPEKLSEVASAVQVVTNEDVVRSTATRLPEALRLATNLQVAQSNAHEWAVTARGFNGAPLSNNTLANKLLVMIDGRTIYTPLFGGVFWGVQNVLLEDLDRIEVVSGPGGTLWGANAVNGVINIMSKNARETQGLLFSESIGTFLQDQISLRYGAQIDSKLFFRVYGQRIDHNPTRRLNGDESNDEWHMTQGGFRMDYYPSSKNTFTLQGDLYAGKTDSAVSDLNGQNVLGRWTHMFTDQSDITLQVYYDRTYRNQDATGLLDVLNTYDADFQHRFPVRKRHKVLWGIGYRIMDDNFRSTPGLSFAPSRRTLELFNGFIQDQISLIPRRLELTLGTKLIHNDYTGFEWQPSARISWLPNHRNTFWAAVSRAVRTPSRLDAEIISPVLGSVQDFRSEKVTAYELGYRMTPTNKISFSLAAFYNNYDHVRSIDTNLNPGPFFVFDNNLDGSSSGIEISANVFLRNWWRIRGGYTFLRTKLSPSTPQVLPASVLVEAQDPRNQLLLQSNMDLPKGFQLDFVGRYVDLVPSTIAVASYITLNARIAWIYRRFTFSINGRNLLQERHTEFGNTQIPRSIYQKITLRL